MIIISCLFFEMSKFPFYVSQWLFKISRCFPPLLPKKNKKNKRHNSIRGLFSIPSAYSLASGQFGGTGYYYVAGAPGFSNQNGVVGSVRVLKSLHLLVVSSGE